MLYSPLLLAIEFGCSDFVKKWGEHVKHEEFLNYAAVNAQGYRQLLTVAHVALSPDVVLKTRVPQDPGHRDAYLSQIKKCMDGLGMLGSTFNELSALEPRNGFCYYTQRPMFQGRGVMSFFCW